MLLKTNAFSGRSGSPGAGRLTSAARRFWHGFRLAPPWDDGAPVRAELFSVERLEQHARRLAAAQTVTPREEKGASLASRLSDNEAVLVAAYRDVAAALAAGAAITPAAAWLIEPISDIHASGDYRRHLAQVLSLRALNDAARRAGVQV